MPRACHGDGDLSRLVALLSGFVQSTCHVIAPDRAHGSPTWWEMQARVQWMRLPRDSRRYRLYLALVGFAGGLLKFDDSSKIKKPPLSWTAQSHEKEAS